MLCCQRVHLLRCCERVMHLCKCRTHAGCETIGDLFVYICITIVQAQESYFVYCRKKNNTPRLALRSTGDMATSANKNGRKTQWVVLLPRKSRKIFETHCFTSMRRGAAKCLGILPPYRQHHILSSVVADHAQTRGLYRGTSHNSSV